MSIDFFRVECQKTTNERKFGLYDAGDAAPAQIKITDEDSWNATVLNKERKQILFTAIDNCIEILRENGEMDNRCDVMLNYENNLLLVELKDKRDSWQTEGLSQIESTVKRMIAVNREYYFSFNKRKAVVANRKHQFPCFQESNVQQRQIFNSKYKMRIQFEAEIKIE